MIPLAFRIGSILIRNRTDIKARKHVVESFASTVAASLKPCGVVAVALSLSREYRLRIFATTIIKKNAEGKTRVIRSRILTLAEGG